MNPLRILPTAAILAVPVVAASCDVGDRMLCVLNQIPMSGHVHPCPQPDPGEAPAPDFVMIGTPGAW